MFLQSIYSYLIIRCHVFAYKRSREGREREKQVVRGFGRVLMCGKGVGVPHDVVRLSFGTNSGLLKTAITTFVCDVNFR
jgi:hypothetical protein